MSDYLQNMFGGQPTNPFQIPPPTMQEILFRTLASSLPPPGRLQVPNTVGGRILGTGARLVGGLADVMGSELGRQRLDELSRKYGVNQELIREARRSFQSTEPEGEPPSIPGQVPTQPSGLLEPTATGTQFELGQGSLLGEIPPTTTPPATPQPRAPARAVSATQPLFNQMSERGLGLGLTTGFIKPGDLFLSAQDQAQIERERSQTGLMQTQNQAALFKLQQDQLQAQRDNAFREALKPGMTIEQVAQLQMRYGPSNNAVEPVTQSFDRIALMRYRDALVKNAERSLDISTAQFNRQDAQGWAGITQNTINSMRQIVGQAINANTALLQEAQRELASYGAVMMMPPEKRPPETQREIAAIQGRIAAASSGIQKAIQDAARLDEISQQLLQGQLGGRQGSISIPTLPTMNVPVPPPSGSPADRVRQKYGIPRG